MADQSGSQPALNKLEMEAAQKLARNIVMQLHPYLKELERKIDEVIRKLDDMATRQAVELAFLEQLTDWDETE